MEAKLNAIAVVVTSFCPLWHKTCILAEFIVVIKCVDTNDFEDEVV